MKGVQSLQRVCSKALLSFKRGSPTILSFVAAGGVIGTTILAVKATSEAIDILRSDGEEKHTKLEVVKSCWKCYIPTALIGISTITCIFGANALNKKQQAAITSAYMLLENSYKEYKEKVKELYGSDVQVKKEIVSDKYEENIDSLSGENHLFYECNYGEFFERRQETVLSAEYRFNLKFISQGYANLNDFYEILGLDKTEAGEVLGWSFGNGYFDCNWIDFKHELLELEDGMECYIIDTLIPPSLNYLSF